MKNIKRMIFGIIIFILILSGILILRSHQTEENYEQEEYDYIEKKSPEEMRQPKEVTDGTMFFTVEKCVQRYLDDAIIRVNRDDILDLNYEYTENDARKEAVYKLLTNQYINKHQITVQNVLSYIHKIEEQVNFTATNMKVSYKDDRIQQYLVTGFIEHADTGSFINNLSLVVVMDIQNKTFQVEPLLESSNEDTVFASNIEIIGIDSNGYNAFNYNRVVKNDIPQKYMEFYLKLALNYPQVAYEYLDQEYREKRFGSVENYEVYIKNNQDEIKNTKLDRFQIETKDGYTQYICIDQDENYYIFKETAIRQFTLLLDTHTTDLPEFIQRYNSATEQQKVAMNIEKVVEALNMKDYSYVYQKLAMGFKQNYFPTEQDFIQYANLIFRNKNKVTYGDFDVKGNTYIYNVTLTDKKGESIQILDKQFIMQLGEGTDFICSFTAGDDKLISDDPVEGNT